jgi:integrase
MGVRRRKVGDTGQCVPKSGELICVRAKRRDRSEGHEHFERDEWRKANARFKEIQAEACAPGQTPKSTAHTFEERALEWCEIKRGRDRETPKSALKRAFPIIGNEDVSDLSRTHLEKLQTKLLDDGNMHNTVKLTMHYVKAVIQRLVDDGIIERDPTVRLKMPARDPLDLGGVVTKEDIPTLSEVHAILESAPDEWRWALFLGFGCGMRVGEIIGVAPFQFEPLTGVLHINAQQQRRGRVSPKSWRGVRDIDLADLVRDEFLRACKGKDPGLPLATGSRGGKPRRETFYKQAWRPALKAAGLEEDAYHFHAARHFCASAMLARQVSIPEVAHYVGDAVETVTRVYAHWLRGAPSLAKQALNETLTPPKSGRHLAPVEDQAQ